MPKEQFEFEWDRTYENLQEALYHAMHDVITRTQGGYRTLAQLAGDMGYDGPGLSKRLNPDNGGPKFTFFDLERFCDLTENVDPIKYLAKKYLSRKEDQEKEAVQRVMAALPDLEKCIDILKRKK